MTNYNMYIYNMFVCKIRNIFHQVFNENRVIVMLKSAAGGQAGGRAGVNFWFPLNNLSLLWPIGDKLDVMGSLHKEAA